jgi:hypothetical protein
MLTPVDNIQPLHKWDRFREPGEGGREYIEVVTPADQCVIARVYEARSNAPLEIVGFGHPLPLPLVLWMIQTGSEAIGEQAEQAAAKRDG